MSADHGHPSDVVSGQASVRLLSQRQGPGPEPLGLDDSSRGAGECDRSCGSTKRGPDLAALNGEPLVQERARVELVPPHCETAAAEPTSEVSAKVMAGEVLHACCRPVGIGQNSGKHDSVLGRRPDWQRQEGLCSSAGQCLGQRRVQVGRGGRRRSRTGTDPRCPGDQLAQGHVKGGFILWFHPQLCRLAVFPTSPTCDPSWIPATRSPRRRTAGGSSCHRRGTELARGGGHQARQSPDRWRRNDGLPEVSAGRPGSDLWSLR